jgi:hypothetical protein
LWKVKLMPITFQKRNQVVDSKIFDERGLGRFNDGFKRHRKFLVEKIASTTLFVTPTTSDIQMKLVNSLYGKKYFSSLV